MSENWYETTAKYDWFITGRAEALHYARLSPEQIAEIQATGLVRGYCKLYCGIRVRGLTLPGVLSRLGAPRCRRCCKMFKFPFGIGSPRNDAECRKLLGLPPMKEESEPI